MDKCIAIMEDLEALPVTQVMLKKNPDIMNTIKKVSHLLLNFYFFLSISHLPSGLYHKLWLPTPKYFVFAKKLKNAVCSR